MTLEPIINQNGEIYIDNTNIIISKVSDLDPGDQYGGGYVFFGGSTPYAIQGGWYDGTFPGVEYQWGCNTTLITGAMGTAIGTGKQNTLDCVNNCGDTNTPAKWVHNRLINGYSDWWLPSKDELYAGHLVYPIGFQATMWSSSQVDSTTVWTLAFNPLRDKIPVARAKTGYYYIMVVREIII